MKAVIAASFLLLSACATPLDQIREMSANDLTNAINKAHTAGDKVAELCWSALSPIVMVSNGVVGIASGLEDARIAAMAVSGPCSGILAPLLITLRP